MTRVINLVHIMCSAIIKPSVLIIQNSKNRLCLVIQILWSSLITGMKRWDLRETGHPSTHDASMENYHPAGKVSEMEGKEAALLQNWRTEGWEGGEGGWGQLGRFPLEVTSSVGDKGGLFFSQRAVSNICNNICSKINTSSCENHLHGLQDHGLVYSSNSHYTWEMFFGVVSFHRNRQKMTKMTPAGLTDRTT